MIALVVLSVVHIQTPQKAPSPSWYVRCPLHACGGRSCTKQLQVGEGGQDITIRKLLYWLLKGYLVNFRDLTCSVWLGCRFL